MKFNTKLNFAAAILSLVLAGAQQSKAGTTTQVPLGMLSGQATTSGTLAHEDDVIEASFTLSTASSFTANTTSYAGGGFEPMITLYDSAGNYVTGESSMHGDAMLTDANLAAGSYILTLSDFLTQQSATSTNLSDGFKGPGGTNFIDDQGNTRTGAYALTVSATSLTSATPEPGTFWLMIPVLLGAGLLKQRRHSSQS